MPHLFELLLCIWRGILVGVILWTDGLVCYRIFGRERRNLHCGLAIGLLEIGIIYVDRDAKLNEYELNLTKSDIQLPKKLTRS